MILDKAADLGTLATQALQSADESTTSAALASVVERVSTVERTLSGLGVAETSFLSSLPRDKTTSVRANLASLRESLESLARAGESELVALASSTGEERGRLAAVTRNAAAVRRSLIDAQGLLLRNWSASVWAGGDDTPLDILAHLPSGEMAGRAQKLIRTLLDAAERDEPLSPTQLHGLRNEALAVTPSLDQLRDETIPSDVLRFWTAAAQDEGTDMSFLTADVLAWLERHDALTSFTVQRRS